MKEALILAVDGGGSNTRALLAAADGTLLGSAAGGPANYHAAGKKTAARSLRLAIEGAYRAANLEIQTAAVGYFGLAGLGRQEDRLVVAELLAEFPPFCEKLCLDSDGSIALAGATAGEPGLAVICGTGSIIYGCNKTGQSARAGGWGPLIGDEGSGYDIGRKGLIAVMRAGDGRGAKTRLTERLLQTLAVSSYEKIVLKVYSKEMQRPQIAALALQVKLAAAAGDAVALAILDEAAEELSLAAAAVITRLGMQSERFPVALTGGGFRHGWQWARGLEGRIQAYAPLAYLSRPVYQPLIGALLLGLKAYYTEIPQAVLEKVRKSLNEQGSAGVDYREP
ncbi:MAG: N-acetylglucosamine kinase [Negativicutes bacterium]|nr:N-acetylglucosamine kinase [Negativicutes bacterium]